MTTDEAIHCDDVLLNRYYDGDLDGDQARRFETHLDECGHCRQRLSAMEAIADRVRMRIQDATEAQDYTALEKTVLTTALRDRRSAKGLSRVPASLKFAIPATVVAGVLLFFGYFHIFPNSPPAPSAIINSFTGSMSSVMIFETPKTRQTILWYSEGVDAKSE